MKRLLLVALAGISGIYAQAQTTETTSATAQSTLKQVPTRSMLVPKSTGNTQTEYNAQVISTNFTVPIIRFNPIKTNPESAATDRKGNISFFNSIGAGVGYYWGRLTEITDKDGKVINTDMENTFGIQTGFLFAANSSNTGNSNIFAWTVGISLLNFQVGYGYEFGTVAANEKRGFMTLAYGIPVSKLMRGGFYKVKVRSLSASQNKLGFVR